MLISSKRGSLAFSIAVALSVIGGCRSTGDDTASGEADHTVGQPVAVNNSYVWAKVSNADFGVGLSSPSGSASTPVAMDDVATLRVNQWLDRYHALVGDVLREHGLTLVAPKPTAALLNEYGPNAWVSPALACPTGWTLRPNGRAVGGASSKNLLLTPDYAYGVDVSDSCISPENWTDKADFVSFFNSQTSACRVALEGDPLTAGANQLTVSGAGCSLYGRTAPFATYATSSTIAVTLDAITWGSESRVADTLAHELGHYYRAHANPTVRKDIDFFYRDTPNGPDRPVAAAESAQYEDVVNQLRNMATPLRLKGAPTLYNTRLAAALYNLRSACPSATITETQFRMLTSGQVTDANKKAYLAFENAMATCGATLSIADASTRDQVTKILRQSRIYVQISETAATLDDALKGLTTDLNQLDVQEAALLAKLQSGTFGWYTTEQEADEIGLELAARAGIDPNEVIANNVHTYEQLDALYARAGVDRGDEVTMATCKKWLAAGFTEKAADGTTQPVHVPIGTISDNHHDGCYRVYNMWREAKHHNYVVAAPLPALTPDWGVIQGHVKLLGGSTPPPTDPKPGTGASGSSSSGSSDPNGDGSNGSNEGDGDSDPEESAPPPRRPRQPVNNATEDSADAGATTVTKTSSGCAQAPSSGGAGNASAFSLAAVAALAFAVRRRRRA